MDENMPGELTLVNDSFMSDEIVCEKVFPYPNPFNSSSKISFKVKKAGQVIINIISVRLNTIKS
jgi:hypothetical protein